MSRASKFPNVEEFRARSAKLGFASGGTAKRPAPKPRVARRGGDTRLLVLWGGLGLLSASLLGWLVVDQGGTGRFVQALGLDAGIFMASTAPAASESGEIAALRQRLAVLERRRVTRPEAGPQPGPRVLPPTAQQRQVILLDAPVQTGSLPSPSAGRQARTRPGPAKQDAPDQSATPAVVPVAGALAIPGVERSRLTPRTMFALDLGGYATLPELTGQWRRIQVGNADLLAGLTPRQTTELRASGKQAFRLIAGPIDKITEAVQLCEIFRSRGVTCRQTTNAGAPL